MAPHSIRRIEFLKDLCNANSYLEIGVNRGATFNNLDFARKVAVDPVFRFDKSAFAGTNSTFYEESSDSFFMKAKTSNSFDIIFIDGLHTYEQTFRDFLNSLQVSHSKSFLLIDDTMPEDAFSAMRSSSRCLQLRQKTHPDEHTTSKSWHGDVFKIIPLIKMFCSNHEYATIVDRGNPQTVVWNKAIMAKPETDLPFKRFNDSRALRFVVESLYRFDFTWAIDNFYDVFQSCEEDALFHYLTSSMSKGV